MWGRVAIGMRLYGDPKADFFACFNRLVTEGLRHGDRVLQPALRGTAVDSLASALRFFLESDCDSLLLVEDDVIFAPDDLARLRDSGGGYDILSALFSARRHPFNPQVFRSVRRSQNDITGLRGTIDVEAVAFGFCLLRRRAVEAVNKRTRGRLARYGLVDECMMFCEDARMEGMKLGVNTDVSIGHLVPAVTVYWDREMEQPRLDYDNYNGTT